MVLFILAVLWAGLIFSWLRERTRVHSVSSITSFSKHLSVLERTTPNPHLSIAGRPREPRALAAPAPPAMFAPVHRRPPVTMTLADARRRRLNILVGLAAGSAITFLLALVAGGQIWLVNIVVDLALVGYVVLLARAQRIHTERRAKVRYFPVSSVRSASREPQPALLLHRSAN